MPDVDDMTQYELIDLLISAAKELVEREKKARCADDGMLLARKIEQSVNKYDDFVSQRPFG